MFTGKSIVCFGGEDADLKLRAKASRSIGTLIRMQGDLEAAEQFLQESLRLARETDDKDEIFRSLASLSILKLQQGDLSQAKAVTEESLAIARELNDRRHISRMLNTLGETARIQEDYEAARGFYKEALTLARQESVTYSISVFTGNLAMVACYQGDDNAALSYALESLKISEELGDIISMGGTLGIFAALAVSAKETGKAARLWGAAQAIYDAHGYKLEKADQIFFDRYINEARAQMGDEAFDEAFDEGKQMRLKKAIALAREAG